MQNTDLLETLSSFATGTAMFIICVLALLIVLKKVPDSKK
jgi:hypothetical protein